MMIERRSGGVAARLVLAAALLTGCERPSEPGAPKVNFGVDRCAVCDMVINDQACVAAVIVRTDKGQETRLFDDIGELFDFEAEPDAPPVLSRFVPDYPSKRWLRAQDATFVVGGTIRTPMSSGIIALRDPAAAKAEAAKHGAAVMTLEEARLARNSRR